MTKEDVLELRREHKLHETIENRLKELFNIVSPGSYTLKEGYGTTSGRTDTTTFIGKGKTIHIELIASRNMVNKDLVNLHQSSADLPIAIILDEVYDPAVTKAYFTSNAKDAFTRFWVSDILDSERQERVLGRLEQLIQDLERSIKPYSVIVSLAEEKISWANYSIGNHKKWDCFKVILSIDNFRNDKNDYLTVGLAAKSGNGDWLAKNFVFIVGSLEHAQIRANVEYEIGAGKRETVAVFISDRSFGNAEDRPMPDFDKDTLRLQIKTASGRDFAISIKPGWIQKG